MKTYSAIIISLFGAALLLNGCAVGPDYRKPVVATPQQWSTEMARGTEAGIEPQTDAWWRSFQDPELTSLIERAVAANLDLKMAAARVEEARAAAGLARSDYFPQTGMQASYAHTRQMGIAPAPGAQNRQNAAVQPFAYETDRYDAGVTMSWELDLFGRIKREQQAALAELSAAQHDRRNMLVALLGDVGSYYADLRGYQLRLDIAERNIVMAEDMVKLTRERVKAGMATERDVAQADAQLQFIAAQVPTLNQNLQRSLHRLGVLLGEPPGALRDELSIRALLPPLPPQVPTGLPSDLLQRRPDIQGAEARLAAATARIGVAKGDYFPRFMLLGSAGRQAAQLHGMTLGLGNYFSFGPAVTLPLFTGGKIDSNVAIQDARVKEALLSYQSIILIALEETENALSAYGNEQERCDRLAASVRSNELAFELANVQYNAGLTDFLTVLDALRELHAGQDLLARSQAEAIKSLVSLFRALGGGWDIFPDS